MIPAVTVKPSLDDVQEALTTVGKIITGVAKGVAQWNVKSTKVGYYAKIVKPSYIRYYLVTISSLEHVEDSTVYVQEEPG